ncbi:MAG TPA: hypothetical protein VGL93_15895 [Streptosporangiaceae bacterium]|jgi:hypothetical protein
MRAKGISYDTGFVRSGGTSRPAFDPDEVRRELRIIRDDLHCTAVRVIGGDPDRLELTASYAADLGLEVWFSPYPLELDEAEMLALFADCAERAERIRGRGAEVVFVTGAEMALMNHGFLPGATQEERLRLLLGDRASLPERIGAISAQVNAFLAQAVATVRARFAGPVTYAAIPLERVDWTPFDIVSADLYRSAEVADRFADGVRSLVAQGKPVAITEFGSAAYRGAADKGALFMDIAELDSRTGTPLRLTGAYERDEPAQAAYITELLEIFDSAGVDAAFVFLFRLDGWPHHPTAAPEHDLDRASPAIVKLQTTPPPTTYPDLPWEPKAAFTAIAAKYAP